MAYESSYESGRQPFLPDTKRGNWANPLDFIYAAIIIAFRVDHFVWFRIRESGVLCFFLVYALCLALYIVPFMVIQSFLGQFSGSGFISAFRVSPLFKGIGYVSLALNIIVVAYVSIYAVVPLVYMFASMNPILPWSCEGFKTWATNLTEHEEINLCNLKFDNESFIPEGSGGDSNETSDNYDRSINHHIPSVMYFANMFHELGQMYKDEFSMSWQLMLCALLVWTMVALVLYKLFDTEMFGTIIRYCVWIILGLMCLFIVRFGFLPGAGSVLYHNFELSWSKLAFNVISIPFHSITAFGPGWGVLITLASFNKFKTNIMKSSCIIGVGQMFIIIGLTLLLGFTERYFGEITNGNYYSVREGIWTLYLSSGSVMAHMAWANLWTILFNFMLFLAAMTIIAVLVRLIKNASKKISSLFSSDVGQIKSLNLIQLKSILTTIYDEFVFLREKKLEVSISLLGLLTACSLYFTSNDGIYYSIAFSSDVFITQNSINLLLILVVLWIYGRVRFQRDIEFMTNQRFSTWFVNLLRFVAPWGFALGLLAGIVVSYYEHLYSNLAILMVAIIFIGLPWLCIPGYAIYQMCMGIGPIKTRFFRCCHPTDWFPVEIEHRQKYDQAMGNAEITQTFSELRAQDNA